MRRSGATPPKVNTYCSNVGTTSTTSMPHPRNLQVLGAMDLVGVRSGPEADAVRSQLGDRGDTEQLHRAGHLAGEEVGGAPHSAFPAGHEPVQVRAADEAGAGAERDRRDDVGPVQDSAVQVDLGAVADRLDHVGQL